MLAENICNGKTLYPKKVRLNKGTKKNIALKFFGKIIINGLLIAIVINNKRYIKPIIIILIY